MPPRNKANGPETDPSPARMSSMHATELASLTSEVKRIDELMSELEAKKATLLAAIARIRLASPMLV